MDVVGGVERRRGELRRVGSDCVGRRRRRAPRSGRPRSGRRHTDRYPARAETTGVAVDADHRGDAAQRVVAVAAGDLVEGHPRAGREGGEERLHRDLVVRAAATPAARRTARAPAIVRGAPGRRDGRRRRRAAPAPSASPPRRRRARSSPTVVPRLRMVAWATCAQRQGQQRLHPSYLSCDASTSACRASAPTRTPSSSHVDVVEVGHAVDVDQHRRRASRIDSSGTRLCPPASTFAPGSAARASSASWRPCGRTYANGAGFKHSWSGHRASAPRRRGFRAVAGRPAG